MSVDIAPLAGIAFCAGFFDSIAGGGGLLTLPALLLAGLDPVAALATNKLQASGASVSATLAFARKKMIDWRLGARIMLGAGLGGLVGSLSIALAPKQLLTAAAPFLLLGFAGFFAFSRGMADTDRAPRWPLRKFVVILPPLIGFYDGVFGPGAGTFYMMAIVAVLGFGAVRATGYTKAANAASNVASLGFFIVQGAVVWPLGLAMMACAFAGAQLGARLAMRFGARLIKPLLVTMSVAMALRLLTRDGGLLSGLLQVAPQFMPR